jgi:hypothetical protein
VGAGAGAVFFAAVLTAAFLSGAGFFAALVGAFSAVFLLAVFFRAGAAFLAAVDCAFAAAFCKRHRFFVAAIILAIPSLLIRRLGFEGSGLAFDGGLECFTVGFFAFPEDACKLTAAFARVTAAFAS